MDGGFDRWKELGPQSMGDLISAAAEVWSVKKCIIIIFLDIFKSDTL